MALAESSEIAADWVGYNAGRFPTRPALQDTAAGVVVSWRELEARVAALAGVLFDRFGIRRGARVVVLAENDVRVFVVQFACMRLGALFVPLNWRLSLAELMTCCMDAEPALVIHDQTWQEYGQTIAGTATDVASWGCDGGADLDRLAQEAVRVPPSVKNRPSDAAQILYTSGTTGTPKGAVITHGGMLAHCLNVVDLCEVWGRPGGERLLTAMPLFHAGGLNSLPNPVLRAGGTVSILRRFDPEQMLRLLARPELGFTHVAGVPVMYQAMADHGLPERFPDGIHAQVGGGYLPPELLSTFGERGLALSSAYGATEMGPMVSAVHRLDALGKPGSCGFPARHTAVRIVDDRGRDVSNGDVGEVWVRGPSVIDRYWRGGHESGFRDGWFRSGDAVRVDEDGFLCLAGRFKDMYKSGGENVFAAEVESVLGAHPDIAEVAVIGVPDPRWGEAGRAVVVPRSGSHIDLAAIEDHCRGKLARYKTPKSIVITDGLPRNVTGKVVKADIRKLYGAEE